MIDFLTTIFLLPSPDQVKGDSGAVFYSRTIWISRAMACLTLVGLCFFIGLASFGSNSSANSSPANVGLKAIIGIVFAPILYGLLGYIAGMVASLNFAPRGFFATKIGAHLLEFIGVSSGVTARIICFLLALFFWGVPTLIVSHFIRLEYEQKWIRPGGWLYEGSAKEKIASAVEVEQAPPPTPEQQCEWICESIRREIKQEECDNIELTAESFFGTLLMRIADARKEFAESPAALMKLDALDAEIESDSWYSFAKSVSLKPDELVDLANQVPQMNSLKMLQLSELQPEEPTIPFESCEEGSTVLLVRRGAALILSRKWNDLLGEKRAKSLESIRKVIFVHARSQVIGLYKTEDNGISEFMVMSLEKALEEHPDGQLPDRGQMAWLYKLGAFRWMHHITLADIEASDNQQSYVVFVDDPESQEISFTSNFLGSARHYDAESANKTMEFISERFGN